MNKRRIIKIAVWSFSIVFVLFIVLVVHIMMVTKPVTYDNNDLQLSRIDFKQDVDSAEAAKIRTFVATLPGVNNAMFNMTDKTLVYGYTVGKQNSNDVYAQLMDYGHYKAEKFVVSETQMNSGCPIGKDKNSLTYKFSAAVYKIFN